MSRWGRKAARLDSRGIVTSKRMHAWFAVFSTIHSSILLTECASESLYSVQNIAIHRIRLIFDSSNTLVYRLGPRCKMCCNKSRVIWNVYNDTTCTVDDFLTVFLNFVFPIVYNWMHSTKFFFVFLFFYGNKIKRAAHTMPNVPRNNIEQNHDLVHE